MSKRRQHSEGCGIAEKRVPERKTKILANERNGTMGGMEFQALRSRNTPAYINLSHNDPIVALTDNILRTWALCRPSDEKRGDKKRYGIRPY